MVKYVSTYTKGTLKKRSVKGLSNDAYVMFLCFFFSDFLFKSICSGYSFELHRLKWVPTIYAFIDKKYTGGNLMTMPL